MPPVITNLAPVTETEAVNVMLSAIGEQPITDISTSTQADVAMAVNILKEATREVLSEGYRFNKEFALRLNPSGTLLWTDPDGSTIPLNIFTPPADLLSFEVSPTVQQQAPNLDLTLRQSKTYTVMSNKVMVFYDRISNRDGLRAALWPFIQVDVVSFMDFLNLPQEARRFITIRAARVFVQHVVGSDSLAQFSEKDELFALRTLKRAHGSKYDANMMDNGSVSRVLGMPYRRLGAVGSRSVRRPQ